MSGITSQLNHLHSPICLSLGFRRNQDWDATHVIIFINQKMVDWSLINCNCRKKIKRFAGASDVSCNENDFKYCFVTGLTQFSLIKENMYLTVWTSAGLVKNYTLTLKYVLLGQKSLTGTSQWPQHDLFLPSVSSCSRGRLCGSNSTQCPQTNEAPRLHLLTTWMFSFSFFYVFFN